MFDPEKVERWADENAIEHHLRFEVVAAADYDKLLGLYREAVRIAQRAMERDSVKQ